MLLVVAALTDEIRVAMGLCSRTTRIDVQGLRAWSGSRNGRPVLLLKTGIGLRSEAQLQRLLQCHTPSKILVTGFAGALDPALTLGELVVVQRASVLKIPESPTWMEECTLSDSFELSFEKELESIAGKLGLRWGTSHCLTSPYMIGDPAQKAALRARFGAGVVDMETAVLARAAQPSGIPVSCIRAISDDAHDALFAPFSRAASSAATFRLGRVAGRGHLILHWDEWQGRVRCAQSSLRQYLRAYLDGTPGIRE
jgi:nucleoside phosphorylase